jgi:hypothetical protein
MVCCNNPRLAAGIPGRLLRARGIKSRSSWASRLLSLLSHPSPIASYPNAVALRLAPYTPEQELGPLPWFPPSCFSRCPHRRDWDSPTGGGCVRSHSNNWGSPEFGEFLTEIQWRREATYRREPDSPRHHRRYDATHPNHVVICVV